MNNRVSGCGWGIFLISGKGSTVQGNLVDRREPRRASASAAANGNTVQGNTVTNCGRGISIEGTSSGNAIYFNDFNNGASVSGVANKFSSPSTLTYSVPRKNLVPHAGQPLGKIRGHRRERGRAG